MKTILMIGINGELIKTLEASGNNYKILLLEEEDVFVKRTKSINSSIVSDIYFGSYQQSQGFMDTVETIFKNYVIDGVLAAVEYAVNAVKLIAQKYDLKYIGAEASEKLTNKLKLRKLAESLDIPQPRYQKIGNQKDIISFFDKKPIVIKPANRQGSVGVLKIENQDEINNRFSMMINAGEGRMVADRTMEWEYMAEEFIEGYEVSIESIVSNGKVIFTNITKKVIKGAPYFIEMGHMVPAILNKQLEKRLRDLQIKLSDGLSFENGIIHSEWIISNNNVPFLVEAAGRVPGDKIITLINNSYGINVSETLAKIVTGDNDPIINKKPILSSSIIFLNPPEGKIEQVRQNVDLDKLENIVEYQINLNPNDTIKPLTSSWSRTGYIIATGETSEASYKRLEDLVKKIKIN